MNWLPLEKWRCEECGELHSDEDDARECCLPEVSEVYICPICDRAHTREEDAKECIKACENEGNSRTYMADKKEMEDQGQMVLAIEPSAG